MNAATGRRLALVTGAGGGIGAAVAVALARAGLDIVVNDLGCAVDGSAAHARAADSTVAVVELEGVAALADGSDISNAEQVHDLGLRLEQRGLAVDVLVNVAGILRAHMVYNLSDEDWQRVLAVHLRGSLLTIHAFLPGMLRSGYGRIVNFTSAAGIVGTFGASNYAAGKAAIVGLTESLALVYGHSGVTVNAVAPFAESRMGEVSRPAGTDWSRRVNPLELNIASQRVQLPLRRDPEQVGSVVAALCSESAGDISGEVFVVSGGQVSVVDDPRVEMVVDNRAGWTAAELERYLPVLLEGR